MKNRAAATVVNVLTLLLAAPAYAGLGVLAWTNLREGCATMFINGMAFGAGSALVFSLAAVSVHGAGRWAFKKAPARPRLLLVAAAPAVLTTTFLVVAFGAVLLLNDPVR